jgi:hypothetical protein
VSILEAVSVVEGIDDIVVRGQAVEPAASCSSIFSRIGTNGARRS